MLNIEVYDNKEIEGKIKLSNRFIRSFRPKLFENGGFPTTIKKEEELVRYIDSMHAYSFLRYYNDLCGGITENEFLLLKKTTNDIYDITTKKYDADFLVKAPMIAAICEKRILESTTPDIKNKRIFEIGPGSGTLGCLLLEDDYKYSATDVTQAFYLIQNRLFDKISKTGINELVTDKLDKNSRCIHIPYWELWNIRENPIDIDIAMSNHALLEMSQSSLRFYLAFLNKAMHKSDDKLIVFQGGGWRIDQNLIDLIELFDEYGFNLKYFNHSKEIACFSLKKGSVKKEVLLALRELLKTNVVERKINALGTTIDSRLGKEKIFYCDDIGNNMNKYFEYIKTVPKVNVKELLKYYNSLGATEESPDEEYAKYIKIRK